jgi:hypothetical protein
MKYSLVLFALLLAVLSVGKETSTSIRLDDDSDWWSSMRTDQPYPSDFKIQAIRTPNSSLQILDVSLLSRDLERDFTQKFGATKEVDRGDAANGRQQYCYVSAGSKAKVYLIFEFGEVESAFYLFSGGSDWKGSEFCKSSILVSKNLGTRSGLKLGMSPLQLEAILGEPSFEQDEHMVYVRNLRIKSSPEELKRARAYAKDMSEGSFQKNYASYEFSTYIEALFKDSKLTYLAIKQDETL